LQPALVSSFKILVSSRWPVLKSRMTRGSIRSVTAQRKRSHSSLSHGRPMDDQPK